MKSLRTTLLASSLLFIAGCSSVSGVVRNKETSTPISSATVTVVNRSSSTTTDAVGHYKLMGTYEQGGRTFESCQARHFL